MRIAQRQASLRGEGLGELGGRLPAKAGMGPFGIIIELMRWMPPPDGILYAMLV